MKKILFFIVAGLLMATSIYSQGLTEVWEKTKPIARETGKEVTKEHLAVTSAGELYAAARFNVTFPFAGQDLEPIANSSYLIKYSATGEEVWGVSIAGAAAVTGITQDDAGNVYLIGRLADEVVFNTTSGDAITKKGNDGTELNSAFAAKYSPAGKVMAVEVFVPEKLDLDYEATPELNLNNIQVAGNKIYVSALLKGKVTNNGVTLASKTANLWGIGYYVDLQSGFIITLSNEMKLENTVAEISVTEGDGQEKVDIFDTTFAVENNVMFMGFVATGNQTLKIGADTKNITLQTPEGGAWEYVYQLAAYNTDTKTILYKDYKVAHDAGYNRCRLNKITPTENGLFLEGTYNGAPLAFDNTLTHTAADDVFTAKLNKTDLTVIKAFTSGIDEGDANKNEEVWVASGTITDQFLQVVQTKVAGGAPIKVYGVHMDFTDNTIGAEDLEPQFVTGFTINKDKVAQAIITPHVTIGDDTTYPLLTYMVSKFESTGVQNAKVTDITLFPNPVVNVINFSETCDAKITGLTGSTVKVVKSATSVDVSNLASGVYFVTVTNEKGSDTFKIVKK